ncbi:biotin--[acetyl-CoA-carboxylase] ligase [Corynebacterium pacaense]|uniref:biotin--[acetyl-CoA-carboxylase] ligase n=1 Tax=Corynebacterium pacaense TaxID=1816684 RepID=UPI00117797C0|nr:biotin--[acetyl-CoA-carboxylase] ligase [Corynebacterium pacaense]
MNRSPLDWDALIRDLVTTGPFARVDYTAETGSTNEDLLRAAREGAPAWTVATTEFQGAGRGRLGRPWTAPPGSQTIFSVLIRPSREQLTSLGTVPLACGLAMMDSLSEHSVPGAGLKWPNDVLVRGRKLCGILVEAASLDTDPAVVIGMGTNITLDTAELPVPHATSLALEGVSVDRTEFIVSVLLNIHRRVGQWAEGERNWLEDYRRVCSSLGQDVRVILPGDREILGVAVGIADGGQLLVRDAAGTVHTLSAGEVTHLRLQ